MANNKKYCVVKNRSAGMAVYRIPEKGIRREFAPGETKKIDFSELIDLSYQPGGRVLMASFLQIVDEEVTNELNIHTENEYYMSEQDVVNVLKTGSLDQLLDVLDYAPQGVMDLVKKFSVELPLNDYEKRKAILDKTGFDVSKALEMKAAEAAEDTSIEEPAAAPVRRTTTNYKVVTPKETPKE